MAGEAGMKLVSSNNFRGSADTAAGKPKTVSQNIWTQLRSPFVLPAHGCGTCTLWERVEFGIMGCRCCGSFHVCCVTTCPTTEVENNQVCTITGTVVKTITYDVNEYLSTASRDVTDTSQGASMGVGRVNRKRTSGKAASATSDAAKRTDNPTSSRGTDNPTSTTTATTTGTSSTPGTAATSNTIKKKHTVSRCINFHERVCLRILCSETTAQCVQKEQVKLRNRLRWSFMRHVRSCKMRRVNSCPNVIVMISRIAGDIENYRLPISNDTASLRRELAYSCAQDIFKFTCSMTQSNALFTMNLDAATMVIGLLYLLRSGLVHQNMTVLPRCRALAHLLPPENYINLFGVKSKIITECENVVKCHLRTLSGGAIKAIGYEALDRVI
jgi:hypothetical protein